VLVVDDSDFMRNALVHILESQHGIRVAGTAADGSEAIREVERLHPDVVLMDIQMPDMDGLVALRHIMEHRPTPVVMLSGLGKREGPLALQSLRYGAVDFIPKPSGVVSYDIGRLAEEIIRKVRVAAISNVYALVRSPMQAAHPPKIGRGSGSGIRLVVIGASTGGPRAIMAILAALPAGLSATVIVAQHMWQSFIPTFVTSLQACCRLQVAVARHGELLEPGRVLVAPGDRETCMVADDTGTRIKLDKAGDEDGYISIDHVMNCAVDACGSATLGVVLTGVGNDGARGLLNIRAAGGRTIAEGPATSIVFGMPRAAIAMGGAEEVLPLPAIAYAITRLAGSCERSYVNAAR